MYPPFTQPSTAVDRFAERCLLTRRVVAFIHDEVADELQATVNGLVLVAVENRS